MNTTEDYWDHKVNWVLADWQDLDEVQQRRQIRLVLQEVERDTRQQAATMASELFQNILDMRPPY